MNPDFTTATDGAAASASVAGVALPRPHWGVWLVTAVAVLALVVSSLLWVRLSSIQEQLARQSADSGAQATAAQAAAKQAQEQAMATAAKLAVTDARLSEVTLQRNQLEELIQSLSRSRDENLVIDIDAAIRMAQQQAQLTGSVAPLMAALKSAELRLSRAAQPRLAPVQRAIARDIEHIKSTALADTPALLVKLDELAMLADELPVGNALPAARGVRPLARQSEETVGSWWLRILLVVREELRGLVRVSHIENPDAALLSPEQSFFLRENFKLKLLNARLGLLSRQVDSVRADLASAAVSLDRFFDASSRKTQMAAAALRQVQGQLKALEVPRIDDTLAALTAAAAGR
jgi:uroporphyrin-3 C-methyltransferase